MTDFMARNGARLVDNGFPVIPIMPGTKKPGRYTRGEWHDYPAWTRHCDRPTTLQEVEIWATWPDAAIGFACGTIVGIDIDILDAALAHRIEKLARQMLGDTPLVRIGRAPKRMLVYRAETPFAAFRRAPLEVLAHGRQFVAFAIHPDTGEPYQWTEESPLSVDVSTLPAITEEQARGWLDAATALVPAADRPATLETADIHAPAIGHDQAGTFDAIAAALAYIPNAELDYDSWIRIGMAIKGALGEDGAPLFLGWSAQSVKNVADTTAKSWAGFKPTTIGAGTLYHLAIQAGWKPDPALVLNGAVRTGSEHPAAALITKAKEAAAPPPPSRISPPPIVYELDGALRLFADYILATAIRPQPWLAIGASLAALGTVMGRRYCTETNLRTNLYVVCMAASGGGKDHPRNCIREALLAAGLDRHIGGNRLVSGSGLLTALYREPASLFQIDEFGQFLDTVIDKRRAPKHLAEIWDLFTELSTSAGSTYFGAEYADQKEHPRRDIIEPCCCIHATTIARTFWAALRSSSLMDGSLARFLVFASDHDIPDRNRRAARLRSVPAALLQALATIEAGVPNQVRGNLVRIGAPVVRPEPYTVPMVPEADALFAELDTEVTERMRQAVDSPFGAVLARVWENTAKVALIKAVSANPRAPVIRDEDARWARAVVDHCVETLLREADRHLGDNETERNHKRVLDLIRAAGPAGLSRNEITRRTQFLEKRQREEIMAALIEGGLAVAEARASGKRAAIVYRIVEDDR